MQTLIYNATSSKCFTNGKEYIVKDSDEVKYYLVVDNQKDEVYVQKSNFKN